VGHIALHYGTPEEGPLAARLLKLLGFIETQDIEFPDGSHFYRFVVDDRHQTRGDGIIYLSAVPGAQRALIEAARESLKVGQPGEHPAVAGMRAALDSDPEYSFHVGVLMDSLATLEQTMLKLEDLAATDPDFKGRLRFTYNRALPGDEAVDARLDASPIYGKVERHAYGRNGVQAFIETDILSSGVLGESMFIELDYVFPGAKSHILSVVEFA
jgi:hypothetical protein